MWRAGGHSSRSDSEKMSNIRLQVLIFRNINNTFLNYLSVCILDSIIHVTLVMSLWVQIRDFARFDCHVKYSFKQCVLQFRRMDHGVLPTSRSVNVSILTLKQCCHVL